MAEQPTWRGHRAPVEDGGGTPGSATVRRARLPVVLGIVLALVVVAGCAALTRKLVRHAPATLPPVIVGSCLSSPDLAAGHSSLRELDTVACGRAHDAEVFALRTMGTGDDLDTMGERCVDAASDLGVDSPALNARDLQVRPLALTDSTPTVGVTVACFVRNSHGTPLRGAVFTSGSDQ